MSDSVGLIDSHCHLDYLAKDGDLAEILSRARRAGVTGMLTIGTKVPEFAKVRAIAEAEPDVWCSVGIHPHEAEPQPSTAPDQLAALSSHPRVVAIGECGLDYFYDRSPRARQQEVFAAHIEAARSTGLPIIVHTRDADEDTARMLTAGAAGGKLTGLIHCFSSGSDLARVALDLGLSISLSGIVTFKNAEALRAVAKDIPDDRLLVETDAPYLAPQPHRGKRNEPAYVVHTAEALAALRGSAPSDLARKTTANFFRLFEKARPCA